MNNIRLAWETIRLIIGKVFACNHSCIDKLMNSNNDIQAEKIVCYKWICTYTTQMKYAAYSLNRTVADTEDMK